MCVTQKRRSLDRKRTHLKALLAFCSPSAAITSTIGIGDHQCYNYDYFQHVLRFHCKCNSNHRHHHLHNHHALIILTKSKIIILTLALASLAASASAAIALCSCTGSRASLLFRRWVTPCRILSPSAPSSWNKALGKKTCHLELLLLVS